PFLTCLATRRAIDRLRQRRRTGPMDGIPEPAARLDDPLSALYLTELLAQVRAALVELPGSQAEVFWLSCIEEMPHQQISDRLHASPGEVRVLLHRARTHLRAVLDRGASIPGGEDERKPAARP